jgi:hypothetical protein
MACHGGWLQVYLAPRKIASHFGRIIERRIQGVRMNPRRQVRNAMTHNH